MSEVKAIDQSGKESWIDVFMAFQRAIRTFETYIQPVLKREGVPKLGVANVLMLLNVGEGVRRISDIVQDEGYCNSNASYALTALEREGLVLRTPDLNDRRVRIVYPTERGLLLIKRLKVAAKASGPEIVETMKTVANFESKLKVAITKERKSKAQVEAPASAPVVIPELPKAAAEKPVHVPTPMAPFRLVLPG